MSIVESVEQIERNAKFFHPKELVSSSADAGYFRSLLKKGKVLYITEMRGELVFAPSRFVGYKNNSRKRHEALKNSYQADGKETNPAISKLIGIKHAESVDLDRIFVDHCESIGIVPSKNERKFWISPKASSLIEKSQTDHFEIDASIPNDVKKHLRESRIGQGKYREDLFELWGGACAVTGSNVECVLIASHIKPWAISSREEKTDRYNGILLSSNVDKLFDQGLITFKDSGAIRRSKRILNDDLAKLGISGCERIKSLKEDHYKFLDFHRKNIFRG